MTAARKSRSRALSEIERLWEQRALALMINAELIAERDALLSIVPAWAQPGPRFLNSDGTFAVEGGISHWPQMEDDPRPALEGAWHLVRPGPDDLRRRFAAHPLGLESPAVRAKYRAALRRLVIRRREQKRLQDDSGYTNTLRKLESVREQIDRLEDGICCRCDPGDAMALAASVMVMSDHDDEHAVYQTVLRWLLPSLKGRIKSDVIAVLA